MKLDLTLWLILKESTGSPTMEVSLTSLIADGVSMAFIVNI